MKARTSPASTSGSSSFKDHQGHQRTNYMVEVNFETTPTLPILLLLLPLRPKTLDTHLLITIG
jgi:hypothetical protein